MKWIIATNNKGKVREFDQILPALGIKAGSLKDEGIVCEPEETGTTFEENALIKARVCCALTGYATVSDDSGLAVDALDGRPGVYSARYAPTEEECVDKLLKEMENVPDGEARHGYYVCAIACVLPDGREFTVRGECHGLITREKIGTNGFGYDPIFFLPQYGTTFGELSSEIKNEISHRGKALAAFAEKLKEMGISNK